MSHKMGVRSIKNPRMIDVARLAGVSHQTVSRVLNASPAVGPELTRRVQEAIRHLGYKRNPAARALASRRSMNSWRNNIRNFSLRAVAYLVWDC